MTTCITTPTRTLYETQTTLEGGQVRKVTVTVPVGPSTYTVVSPSTSCLPGGSQCVVSTKTFWHSIPATSTSTVSTIYLPSFTVFMAVPTATLYGSPCFPTTATITDIQTTFVSVPSATTTVISSKTLAGPDTDNGPSLGPSGVRRSINVGAIVGGLIGGFLAPFILILLFRWLRRRHILRSLNSPPPEDMRSVEGGHGSPIPRPLSPVILPPIRRTSTRDASAPNEQGNIDRRASRASRTSRISYDQRSAVSPVGSLYDYPVSLGRRSSNGHHHSLSFDRARPSSPPLAPSIVVRNEYSPPPLAQYGVSASGSGAIFSFPYDHRRTMSPVSLSDHPYALAQPVPSGVSNSAPSEYVSPSNHGLALPSVEEWQESPPSVTVELDSPRSDTIEIHSVHDSDGIEGQETSLSSSTVSDIVNVHPPQIVEDQRTAECDSRTP